MFDSSTINSYAAVQNLLNDFVTSAGVTPALAPHKVFWEDLDYNEFVTGNVPGVQGGTIPILVKGDADSSNLIKILKGPLTSFRINQMPEYSPPYNAASPSQSDVINGLTYWIINNCPEFAASIT